MYVNCTLIKKKKTLLVKDLHPEYIKNSENLKQQYNLKNTSADCVLLMGIM